MSKGIIAVDIPKLCDKCPIRHPGLAKCQMTGRSTSHTSTGKPMDEKKRPGWCPIRMLPERKPPSQLTLSPILKEYHNPYNKGWNNCLDELLGE